MSPDPAAPRPLSVDELESIRAGERAGMFAPPELVLRLLQTVDYLGSKNGSTTPTGAVYADDILAALTRRFGIARADLARKRVQGHVGEARSVGCFLFRKMTRFSLVEIGKYLGGIDHATVLYKIDRVRAAMVDDADFAALLRALEEDVRALAAARQPAGGR